jgi:hypothetical protein
MAQRTTEDRAVASQFAYRRELHEATPREIYREAEPTLDARRDAATTPDSIEAYRVSLLDLRPRATQPQDWCWRERMTEAWELLARNAGLCRIGLCAAPRASALAAIVRKHVAAAALRLDALGARAVRARSPRVGVAAPHSLLRANATRRRRAPRSPGQCEDGHGTQKLPRSWANASALAEACSAAADYHVLNNYDGTSEFEGP